MEGRSVVRWDGVLETGEYGRVVLIRDLFVVLFGRVSAMCESVCVCVLTERETGERGKGAKKSENKSLRIHDHHSQSADAPHQYACPLLVWRWLNRGVSGLRPGAPGVTPIGSLELRCTRGLQTSRLCWTAFALRIASICDRVVKRPASFIGGGFVSGIKQSLSW